MREITKNNYKPKPFRYGSLSWQFREYAEFYSPGRQDTDWPLELITWARPAESTTLGTQQR